MSAPTATDASVRWVRRSVERRYGDEVTSWRPDPEHGEGLNAHLGARATTSEDGAARLRLRMGLDLSEPECSAALECIVEFEFSDHPGELTPEEATEFARGEGLPFAMGYLRAALSDARLSVGLNAVSFSARLPGGLAEAVGSAISSDADR